MTVLQTIRLLVIIQLLTITRCQDGFGNREILQYQQVGSNNGQGQINSYNDYGATMQREQAAQVLHSALQFNNADNSDKNEYNQPPKARSRKVYHIKNPFQNQGDSDEKSQENQNPQDSTGGASNQYASVQYSLPPEEFLQQLRAENQYYQQQLSTPAPNVAFTATPQPQYQYSTISVSSSNYDTNNQQSNLLHQDLKPAQTYISSPSSYQYSTPNTYLDNIQSTPSSATPYVSTPISNGQFVGTQSSSYLSSSSPLYLSSPSNWPQYVSSPLAPVQTGSPGYNDNDQSKRNQFTQYDYSSNGLRSPTNFQQYQNDHSTTTTTASPYIVSRETWPISSGPNAISKPVQGVSFEQYANTAYNSNHNDQSRGQSNFVSNNEGDTHRMGNMAAANNIYVNYLQPDKVHSRDVGQETGQKELYSNGDYGWKLTDKKAVANDDAFSTSYSRYQTPKHSSDSSAVSQMNFHMDTSRPQNYDKVSKSAADSIEALEFAKAAAKAHDRYKQQQQFYEHHYNIRNSGNEPTSNVETSYYGNVDVQRNRHGDNFNGNHYSYNNLQNDLITASPYYFTNFKDNGETKSKQPFDHDKALKNIVSIGVSNVVPNSDTHGKTPANLENSDRFNIQNYKKEQSDQQQYLRPVTDSYYSDKNGLYSFSIKSKPDEYVSTDNLKQLESYIYEKNQQSQEQPYSVSNYQSLPQNFANSPHISSYQDSSVQASQYQQSGLHRTQNQMSPDITNILKLNDVPYRLTQGLSSDALRLHNLNFDQGANVLPTPLPSRINQNVDTHQLDIATSLINKLLLNKHLTANTNRPDINSQQDTLSTIHGFKVANPYNVDLKLVADMLKGKSSFDDSQIKSMKDQYTKTPLKLDLSQLQTLLNNENSANLRLINEPLSGIGSPFMEFYNSGRYPHQGVKYSRSEEEEESIIPIVESSNTHPIGAVMDQGDSLSEREVSGFSDITVQEDDFASPNLDEDKPKTSYTSSNHKSLADRHKTSNTLNSGRYTHPRKYPKSEVEEPYPLLKPPPRTSGVRNNYTRMEKNNRRRRVSKPKYLRVLKTEPLFEAGTEPETLETSMPILLRPPRVAEAKSDVDENQST